MRINLDWLHDYVDFDAPVHELADRLTLTSLESVPLLEKSDFFEAVTVGQVQSVEPHPDADKLLVCRVKVREEETRQILCGAPNVAPDQKVPVIHPGTTLPDGNTIESVTLRGVDSRGMIPSERELGLSDSHAGIMVLREEAEVGQSFWSYLEQYWSGLDIEVTPNRPDCMSHLGIAREVGAMYEAELRRPELHINESTEHITSLAKIVIHEPEKCPRYAARIIKNVPIEPSPLWLQQRLMAVGLRPINNIVDLSNYVLMETGHPLHTFDLEKLAENTIEVRSAMNGELFTTLDGKERELSEEVLLICDANNPVAIAGIMGGANPEVTENTTNILIESAYFNPTAVRRGSKYLGLSTEASKRFERGADPEGVIYALNRITSLIQEMTGGEVVEGILDQYPAPITPREIVIRADRTSKLIGVDISPGEIGDILTPLGCRIIEENQNSLRVSVPMFRLDLAREVDLIEEVVRFYGMENVPSPDLFQYHTQEIQSGDTGLTRRVANLWKGFGFNQTVSNSLVKQEYCFPEVTGKTPVKVRNPLSEEMAYLRTTLMPLLVEGVQKNLNRQEVDIRLFEFGRVFNANPDVATQANEYKHLAVIASGHTAPRTWSAEQKKIDFYEFKGYIESMLEMVGVSEYSFDRLDSDLFQPGFTLSVNGKLTGTGGQINQTFLQKFDIEEKLFGLESDLDVVSEAVPEEFDYQKPSDYPAVERDLSFIVPKELEEAKLGTTLQKAGGELLADITLYDLYEGDPIPADKKSLTYSLRFISEERTLTEKEVDSVVRQILDRAAKNHNAYLREE